MEAMALTESTYYILLSLYWISSRIPLTSVTLSRP